MISTRQYLFAVCLVAAIISSCNGAKKIINLRTPVGEGLSGTAFYQQAAAFNWQKRDSLAVEAILNGNIPSFLKIFTAIHTRIVDSVQHKEIKATYFVAKDYLSVGNDKDWARIPLTPMAAQKIADSLHCFLPTKKMVDDIYKAAKVKLAPMPMFAFRDSTVTMWQHHLIVEGQRKNAKGLIAGIKKDVVLSSKITESGKLNHEAIYGWHKPDGKPIQPLYVGHINWWVDYSHGIRLIYEKIWVDGKPMQYTEVLLNPNLKRLLCDEADCSFYRYAY